MNSRSRPERPASVFLVTVDVSGDHLGAALIRAMKDMAGDGVAFSGVGGREMAGAGMPSLFPIDDFAIVGIATLPKHFFHMLGRLYETVDAVIAARPDILVIIDCPDFSHRVASMVRRRNPDIVIVDYVAPQVWAWRPSRARTMRRYIDHVLALLPFEPAELRRLEGPACSYVGHPLIEHVNELRPNAEEARRRMTDPPVLLVLPGSRSSEVNRHLGVFREAVDAVARQAGPLDVVIPTTPALEGRIRDRLRDWNVPARIVTDLDEKRAAFRVARAALSKSGTVTLELAVAGVPTVAAYRMSWFEWTLGKQLVSVPTVILANLVLGERVIPEFLQHDCTASNLAGALLPLLSDTPERRRQIEKLRRLDEVMQVGTADPARRAAEIVLGMMEPQGALPAALRQ